MEQKIPSAPGGAGPNDIARQLVRDLTELARAQAKLTAHLLDIVERVALLGDEPSHAEPPAPEPGAEPDPESELEVVPILENTEAMEETPVSSLEEEAGADEGEEDEAGAHPPDEKVLVLESGDARVAVLWGQVMQIGSITTPELPGHVDAKGGPVDLVSLGALLHGVSQAERYFVVLSQEGERIAVACERMLGLGPLSSMMEKDKKRLEVLQVGLLRTFARSATKSKTEASSDATRRAPAWQDDDERDRNGPRRALVAVRYLPARVAICRFLRAKGWQVGEAAGLEAAAVSLDLGHWDAFFLEAGANGDLQEAEIKLLQRIDTLDVPLIRVGSRISGHPGHSGPALMFPFSEADVEAILAGRGIPSGSSGH